MSENKKETKNQDMIEKEMKEKMKQTVEDEKIPGSLEPEAVEKMFSATQLKYSMIIFTTLPIIFTYPFFQKYFIKGVMVGSLKG